MKFDITRLGIEFLNPMQQEMLQEVRRERQLVLLSPTGSGKTLAYLLPLLQLLDSKSDTLQALVLVPSRELAIQTVDVVKRICQEVRVIACYGGRPAMDEHRQIKGVNPHMIVATPGRILDHIRKQNITPATIVNLVIDEFDKCLELGFQEDMKAIISELASVERRILLSATDCPSIPDFAGSSDYCRLSYLDVEEPCSDRIAIRSVLSPDKDKLSTLKSLLCMLGAQKSLVFANHRQSVERIGSYLSAEGIMADVFHGGMEQRDRERALYRIINASCNVFVSPDSTGWDVTIPGKLFERDLASRDTTIEYYSTINIEFDGNGGVVQDDTKLVPVIGSEYDTIGALPTPTRDGINFLGWYTMKYGGELVTPDTLITEEMTLYAHWTEASIPSGTPILDIEKNILVSVDLNGATTVEIPNGVVGIASNAFENCENVELVSIPESVAAIPNATFANCDGLWANWYKAMAKGGDATDSVTLTVTNVVVHYVTASVPSTAVTPAEQTGLVNIIAEVTSGGPVAIASTWMEQYPGFEERFGSDFTAALTKPTGKRDSAGNAMLVWQDFVAGTDPTKDDDVFTASITFDSSGNPVISYTPELSEAETAKRTYRKFGKVKLNDAVWTEIPDGEEDSYNFFKISVEMK